LIDRRAPRALPFALAAGFAICGGRACAAELPSTLAPPAPFPLIVSQSLEREFVAPGVERAAYRLQTSSGPLIVSLVAFDPREPSVRVGTVLARDRIVSSGETVSSMAERSGAVAGINADYFDIGNTNTPLGVLEQNGSLVRTPSTRVALTVGRDRSIRFQTFGFHGDAVDNGAQTIPIGAVNEWPPHDGAAFLTPSYGIPPAATGTTVDELTPVPAPSAPALAPGGRYRVTRVDVDAAPQQPGFALALGPGVQAGLSAAPDVGDLIDVDLATDPPLEGVLHAIGGGPALLQGGSPVDDPASPGYAQRLRRIPVSAAAVLRDGDVALVVIDGRRPAVSIGVDRPELIALLSGLGAVDAMQFDGGGSSTLVARVLGDARATVQNDPSDGVERPVADGFFVYSDAPIGPPARLVVRPDSIVALPGSDVPLRSSIVDAAGHPLGPAAGPWSVRGGGATVTPDDVLHVADTPQAGTLTLARGGVDAMLPLEIVPAVSRILITPERPDLEPRAGLELRARAFDERGRPIEIGDHVRWSALRGSVDARGDFTATGVDGFVTASIGEVSSSEIIHVGRHRAPLPGFAGAEREQWHFSSIPAGGSGGITFTPQGTLQLAYDFSAAERAAYANAGLPLGEPVALSCAIDGDGQGAGVRVALLDRYGERTTLTLAKNVDWTGLQRREVSVPPALVPPLALQSIYVIGSLGGTPVKSAGTIGIHACDMTLPGTPPQTP
jgi:hypothetical protein